ncbi:MAG TPA: glucose-6-phosphate isomerase [Candidatus Hydrogenedens sp.]|nr:glucose-6-phosphate isomerase [Candidatus Hydrogenedens sp.]
MNQNINIDISLCHANKISSNHGFIDEELESLNRQIKEYHNEIIQERKVKKYGFFELYKDKGTIEKIKNAAAEFLNHGIENLVILGIGGSALGTTALNTALNGPYYNLLSREQRNGFPRLFVMDNIDPTTFKRVMGLCPPEKTLYNAISKSGETAETICQLLIVLKELENYFSPEKIKEHLVITTSPKGENTPKSLLHPIAEKYSTVQFEIPINVGGRFSVFSPVSLFPASLLGFDIEALSEGCAEMDTECSNSSIENNPAYQFAGVHYFLDKNKGKKISVMMPYSDRLKDIAGWYCQLWAESLGKKDDIDGNKIFNGQTPVKALGATDQHSQIQLYREGPNDKIINMILVKNLGEVLTVPEILDEIPELEYIRGQSMNDLLYAEFQGTKDALTLSQRPVVLIQMEKVSEYTVAQLLYMLEVATAMAGKLYRVNAFNQPGVEEGKRIARRLMLEKKQNSVQKCATIHL